MSILYKPSRARLTTSLTAVYTASARHVNVVTAASAVNYSGTDQTITLHIIGQAESAADSNKILIDVPVPAGETVMLDIVGHGIEQGGTISALASADTSVTLYLNAADIY